MPLGDDPTARPSSLINIDTTAFDQNTAATHTVFTPDAGQRFVIFRAFLYFDGDNTITFQSAANNLSGAMFFADGCYMSWGESGEQFVLKGAATGEAFRIVLGSAQQVSGWFNIGTIDQ